MDRRGFLKNIMIAGVAPAFIKSESLMGLYVPEPEIIFLNAKHGTELIFLNANRGTEIIVHKARMDYDTGIIRCPYIPQTKLIT